MRDAVTISADPTTRELVEHLERARGDVEIANMVASINSQLKAILGPGYWLTFDRTNLSRNIRDRVSIRLPA